MAEHLPVVAVIPNYNMGDNLGKLLPEVLAQRYDCVFVLDDASTDHSLDVIRGFNDEVKLVRSPENRGAGANRNQIIDHIADGVLIHFIDADMDLATAEIPAVAREVVGRYADRGVGLVGGLIRQLDGGQFPYNYGAVFSLWGNLTSNFPGLINRLREKPRLAQTVQRVAAPFTTDWPNVLEPPVPAPVYWVSEANMLVYSSVFDRLAAMTLGCGHTRFRIWRSAWNAWASSDSSIPASRSFIIALMLEARIAISGSSRQCFT